MARATASAVEHPARTLEAVRAELTAASARREAARQRLAEIRALVDANIQPERPAVSRSEYLVGQGRRSRRGSATRRGRAARRSTPARAR